MWYIRGALKMLQLIVKVELITDELKGDKNNTIKLTLIEVLDELYEDDE